MTETNSSKLIVRVYGLILSESQEVLISDEFQLGVKMTKFPGGGLEYGEGPVDCLKREMLEEANQEIMDIQHFYTTDFFQKALFYNDRQLISIYYQAKLQTPVKFQISKIPFDFPEMINGSQSFRWVSLDLLNPDEFTFPIDKHVAHLLKHSISDKI